VAPGPNIDRNKRERRGQERKIEEWTKDLDIMNNSSEKNERKTY